MRVAFGTDEATPVTDAVKAHLAAQGHDVVVVAEADPWPDVGRGVGEAVASGAADRGVVCCWTGTGVAMAATCGYAGFLLSPPLIGLFAEGFSLRAALIALAAAMLIVALAAPRVLGPSLDRSQLDRPGAHG